MFADMVEINVSGVTTCINRANVCEVRKSWNPNAYPCGGAYPAGMTPLNPRYGRIDLIYNGYVSALSYDNEEEMNAHYNLIKGS